MEEFEKYGGSANTALSSSDTVVSSLLAQAMVNVAKWVWLRGFFPVGARTEGDEEVGDLEFAAVAVRRQRRWTSSNPFFHLKFAQRQRRWASSNPFFPLEFAAAAKEVGGVKSLLPPRVPATT
ncbi:unnamed protein product, partial [Linum tenue]